MSEYQDMFDANRAIIAAYGHVVEAAALRLTPMGKQHDIGMYSIDLFKHPLPNGETNFVGHIFHGNKRLKEVQIFKGADDQASADHLKQESADALAEFVKTEKRV